VLVTALEAGNDSEMTPDVETAGADPETRLDVGNALPLAVAVAGNDSEMTTDVENAGNDAETRLDVGNALPVAVTVAEALGRNARQVVKTTTCAGKLLAGALAVMKVELAVGADPEADSKLVTATALDSTEITGVRAAMVVDSIMVVSITPTEPLAVGRLKEAETVWVGLSKVTVRHVV